ncbi:MAG: MerR family transcriptional regulator [Christensenella sp.]|uniref:MerR family transcriptional regulator n=1 Tax=Christensenella sp. TaxID=1935934 RepID=UPI002B1F0667|nr:MerR family transcriptional regulator [Christensenella sp.]MEA5004548.1 MerR family transcriptional regulator [Christensenella sp.]
MALNYKTCGYCGRIFQSSGASACPECLRKMEDQFKTIKEYLYQHPRASVEEVSKETEIDEKLILHFLREGRLEMVAADGFLVCEKCGAPITSGRLCKKCSDTLAHALGSVLPKQNHVDEDQTNNRKSMGSGKMDKLHVNINSRK